MVEEPHRGAGYTSVDRKIVVKSLVIRFKLNYLKKQAIYWGRPRRTYIDHIGEVLQKGQVHCTRNRRACMIRCMNVDEARGVCKDRSRWRSVVSACFPPWEKGVRLCMYKI